MYLVIYLFTYLFLFLFLFLFFRRNVENVAGVATRRLWVSLDANRRFLTAPPHCTTSQPPRTLNFPCHACIRLVVTTLRVCCSVCAHLDDGGFASLAGQSKQSINNFQLYVVNYYKLNILLIPGGATYRHTAGSRSRQQHEIDHLRPTHSGTIVLSCRLRSGANDAKNIWKIIWKSPRAFCFSTNNAVWVKTMQTLYNLKQTEKRTEKRG